MRVRSPHLPSRRSARLWVAVGFTAYLLVGAWLLLRPVPDAPATGVGVVLDWLHAAGFGSWSGVDAEFLCNVLLFVPASALGPWLVPRLPRWWWPVGGILASGFVELVQTVALPHRSGSLVDLAANSLGAVAGWGLAWLVSTDHARPAPPAGTPSAGPLLVVASAVLLLVTLGPEATRWWANQLDRLAGVGVPGLLTDIGGWRMLASASLVGALVWALSGWEPGWSATRWAAVGTGPGLVLAVLSGQVLTNTAAAASLVLAAGCGAFVGAWLARARAATRPVPVPSRSAL